MSASGALALPVPAYELLDPDVRLMLEVRDDNAAAFEELVLRYQGRLLTVLEHMVRDRTQAEDLVQEVFLRVYRARKSYTPGARFSTWLFTIANNAAANALRSRSRRREVRLEPPGQDTGAQPLQHLALEKSSLMPTRRLDKAEMEQMVRQAVDQLPERQRLGLLLSKFEGMSYDDIGKTMGLSAKAVKSLLMRARVNLREILGPYFETGVKPGGADREPDTDAAPRHVAEQAAEP